MGFSLIAYIDTHIAIWLAEGRIQKLTQRALDAVNEHDLRVSPFVSFELGLLFEKNKIQRPAPAILRQLRAQLDVRICDFALTEIAETALAELWTREPMDRMIVAHARANNYSPLISADEMIRSNYPRTIW